LSVWWRLARRDLLGAFSSFAHVAHEAEALARQRADQPLLRSVVADRCSSRVNAGGERRFRDDSPTPDTCDQVVLGDHAFAVADEVLQKVENLRLDSKEARPAAQLALVGVQNIIFKRIQQLTGPNRHLKACARSKNQENGKDKLRPCESGVSRLLTSFIQVRSNDRRVRFSALPSAKDTRRCQ
jgi:hypothetical protein